MGEEPSWPLWRDASGRHPTKHRRAETLRISTYADGRGGHDLRTSTDAIASLGFLVGAIAVVILIGVEAALVFAVWRYRASRHTTPASEVTGNVPLEVAWTAIPTFTLIVVFVLMVGTMREISVSTDPGPNTLSMTVRGHQWWWEVRYPQLGGTDVVTANEIHIPVGTEIDVSLESADVIHSFWVPELAGKMDLIPGRTNHLRLYASKPGTYVGACAEFCGVEHAWMRIRVIAQTPAGFERWLAEQRAPRVAPTGLAAEGEKVFTQSICASCHTVRGTSGAGTAGPDLTHVASRETLGAGVLTDTDAHMRDWIESPQTYKPGAWMPDVPLSSHDLDALTAYLRSLR